MPKPYLLRYKNTQNKINQYCIQIISELFDESFPQ